jgi:hypothetical protein
MPAKPGSFIRTRKGIRGLLNDELAKGLGVPKSWLGDFYPSGKAVASTVPLHLLKSLTSSFVYPNTTAPSDGLVDIHPSLDIPTHNESSFD